jgi:phospholipid/cholesterol/gamma-HCH transport system permease protein
MRSIILKIGEYPSIILEHIGGVCILVWKIVLSFLPPDFDRRETIRNMYHMGIKSLPIIALTALMTGAIMVIQAGMYIKRFGAYSLVGAGAGYATLREVGPVLIALMFSGRVGSNNTAEISNMVVTEQIDALRILAIDPFRFLIIPRIISMILMLFCLTAIGDIVAIFGGGVTGYLLMDISASTYLNSITEYLRLADLYSGLIKSFAFGLIIALVSCYFGLSVKEGARGVGRAVNSSVVASAIGVLLVDYVITYLLK